MRIFSLFILLAASFTLFAQSSAWDGEFNGNLVGVGAILTGKAKGDTWQASINAGSYIFDLDGSIANGICNGNMVDAQNKASAPFKASLSGTQLTLSINDINPTTGLKEQMDFLFTKNNEASTAQNQGTIKSGTEKNIIDPSLIGHWRYTESYVSGEFSFATDWHLQFLQDGSFIHSEGRTAGGGPNSSIDSGDGKVQKGQWKTENKVLWLNDGNGWQAYARYASDKNYLMLTFGNGNKQVWEKL